MADKHLIRVPGARRLPPLGTEFVHVEVLSGIVLALATVVALVLANVATAGYEEFWHTSLKLGVGDLAIDETLQHWVNDGLMTLFFFVVGLEIKRELVVGDLRDRQTAALPVAAAVGGMVVPALIFVALNLGGEGIDGWAIPMATDIAFALAVLAIVGSKAPKELKLFLLTLAIVDDIGAIVVIALFYGEGIELRWLAGTAAVVVVIALDAAGLTGPPGVVRAARCGPLGLSPSSPGSTPPSPGWSSDSSPRPARWRAGRCWSSWRTGCTRGPASWSSPCSRWPTPASCWTTPASRPR